MRRVQLGHNIRRTWFYDEEAVAPSHDDILNPKSRGNGVPMNDVTTGTAEAELMRDTNCGYLRLDRIVYLGKR